MPLLSYNASNIDKKISVREKPNCLKKGTVRPHLFSRGASSVRNILPKMCHSYRITPRTVGRSLYERNRIASSRLPSQSMSKSVIHLRSAPSSSSSEDFKQHRRHHGQWFRHEIGRTTVSGARTADSVHKARAVRVKNCVGFNGAGE